MVVDRAQQLHRRRQLDGRVARRQRRRVARGARVVARGDGGKVAADSLVEDAKLDARVAQDVGVGRPPRRRRLQQVRDDRRLVPVEVMGRPSENCAELRRIARAAYSFCDETASSGTPSCSQTAVQYAQSSSHGQSPRAACVLLLQPDPKVERAALVPSATSCWSARRVDAARQQHRHLLVGRRRRRQHEDSAAGSAEAAVTGAGDAGGAAAAASSCSLIVRSMLSTPLRRPAASVVWSPLASARARLLSAASAAGGAPWSPRASSATMPRATRESAVPPTRSAPSARCARTWTTEVQPRTRVPSASSSAAAPPLRRRQPLAEPEQPQRALALGRRRAQHRGEAAQVARERVVGRDESATGGAREMEWCGAAI